MTNDEKQTGLTRRQVMLGAVGLAAAPVLLKFGAACGGSPSGGTSASATAAGTPRRGGILTVAITDTTASESLDPAKGFVASMYVLTGLLYNTLTNVNYLDWSVKPELAESWEPNADFTQWQFNLRKGVTFADGSPLTAKDVVWTMQRILDPKVGSSELIRAQMTMTPDGLKAVDDSTLLIKLKGPDSLLPVLVGRMNWAIVKNGTDQFDVNTAVGSGPFKLKSWRAGTSWEVERNPSYWETGLPYLDGVREVVNAESAARVQGVLSGEFGLAEEIDYASAKSLANSSEAQLLAFMKGVVRVIVFDCSVKPWTDERVRMAFKLAMDRNVAVQSVYQGLATATSDINLLPDDPYYPPELGVRPYDPEQAKSLLAAAGYPDGLDVEMMTSNVYSAMPDLAVAYAQTAEAAGIRVNIKQAAAATYWDKVWMVEPFYTTYWQPNYPPDDLWYMYGPKSVFNEAKLDMPVFAQLFDQILKTGDQQKQIELTQQGHAIAADKWAHVIPAVCQSPWLANTKLKGVQGDPPMFRVRLKQAYFEA
jgi:peptide/nickel transport system substrate-binding protein